MERRCSPRGRTLYQHGTMAGGIYLLESRRGSRAVAGTRQSKQLLEVAGEGAILGLSEALSGDNYRVTAEADEATTASFIARKDFVELLDGHHEFCMQVVRLLSESLHGLYHRFRSVSAHPGRPRRRVLDEKLN